MKLKQMEKACKLREQGFSMEQIANTLNVSKSSVSNWVKDIELSKGALAHIKSRRQLGREHARESRLKNIFRQRTVLYEKCSTEILPLSIRDLWIAGLMLYAGEGRKAWNVSGQPVELTSSEPDILRIFINFLIKVCNIPRNKIKIRLFLYPDINLKEAKNFWARELKMPLEQFQKSFIKQSHKNPSSVRRSRYGTAHIVLYNAELYRKILGWLRAVYNNYKGK